MMHKFVKDLGENYDKFNEVRRAYDKSKEVIEEIIE